MNKTAVNRELSEAPGFEDIKPLVELCKAGKLFEVQDWINAGKPVDPPTGRGSRPRSPLEVAIENGFHSLVQVLLEAGASFERTGRSSVMSRALRERRPDIVKLLVDHGYDATSVDMREVFETWDGELMEYFVDRGASVDDSNPLAHALCGRIQTALRILKRDRHRFPSFQRQADIALRYHCKEGNLKWVALMLWAGADPYSVGPEEPDADPSDEDSGCSALAFAALYGHFEVFQQKQLKLNVEHPALRQVAQYSCSREGMDFLKLLFERGLKVNDQENGGSSLLQNALERMSWNLRFGQSGDCVGKGQLDTREAKEQIDVIELLVGYGARWVPNDADEINSARRSLLKLVPRFTLAFFSIMATNKACSRGDIQSLLGSATMKKHLGNQAHLVTKFIPSFPDDHQSGEK